MIDKLNDTVAAELRSQAARKNVTRAQVARNLGLPTMYVQRRFVADAEISVTDLVKLARGIGVEPLDVLAQVLSDLERGVEPIDGAELDVDVAAVGT